MPRHLPPATLVPSTPQRRRHAPARRSDYHDYRECVRSDFGFTCAWCLVSEPDLREAESAAVRRWSMQIDHVLPRESHAEREADYSNLVLACSNCNRTKSSYDPSRGGGAALLDPTDIAWGDHFDARDGDLVARTEAAREVAQRVGVNHDLKRALRRARAAKVGALLRRVEVGRLESRTHRVTLLRLLDEPGRTAAEREALAAALTGLDGALAPLLDALARWALPPPGTPECLCDERACSLPSWLDEQMLTTT